MDIKLDHYKIFFEVANNLSFSRAAEQLFITQSAVSQSVRHLESQLDTRLFIRGKKGVSLTPEGELLYEYIKNAIFLIDKGEREIQKIKNLETGNLRIGVSDTISRYLLLPYLEKFNRTYPMVNLQIVNRTSIQAVDLLKSGQVDLAFVNLPLTDAYCFPLCLSVIRKWVVLPSISRSSRSFSIETSPVTSVNASSDALVGLNGRSACVSFPEAQPAAKHTVTDNTHTTAKIFLINIIKNHRNIQLLLHQYDRNDNS